MIYLSKLALEDIIKSKTYYDNLEVGLGKKYITDLERTFNILEKFPELGSNRYSDYSNKFKMKFVMLKTFPFMIFYRLDRENVSVIRVLHMSQDVKHQLFL